MYKSDRYDFIFDKEEQLEFDFEENLSSKIVDKREPKKLESQIRFSKDGTEATIVSGHDLDDSIHTLVKFCFALITNEIYRDVKTLKVVDLYGNVSEHCISKLK